MKIRIQGSAEEIELLTQMLSTKSEPIKVHHNKRDNLSRIYVDFEPHGFELMELLKQIELKRKGLVVNEEFDRQFPLPF